MSTLQVAYAKGGKTGDRYGSLVLCSPTTKRQSGSVIWICKCDCGREREVSLRNLRFGNVNACIGHKKEEAPIGE